MIRLIRSREPRSIYALAKIARRSFPSVLEDVQTLARHGLLRLPREKGSPRRAIRPRVEYDAINLWIGL